MNRIKKEFQKLSISPNTQIITNEEIYIVLNGGEIPLHCNQAQKDLFRNIMNLSLNAIDTRPITITRK